MTIKKIVLILTAFVSGIIPLFAQPSLIIKDTVIERGASTFIPVYGTLDYNPLNELKIVLRYDSRLIDIISVRGASSYAVADVKMDANYVFNNLSNAVVTLSADSVKSVQNGIICMLEVEGLVFSDSNAYIFPEALFVNDLSVGVITTDTAHIFVKGLPIFQGLKEGIGLNYPNPFSWYTTFKISLEDKTKINFHIYSSAGSLVYSSDNYTDDFKLFFIKSDGTGENIDNLNKELEPGNYELVLAPSPWLLSSGAYYMILETKRAVYNTNFIYQK